MLYIRGELGGLAHRVSSPPPPPPRWLPSQVTLVRISCQSESKEANAQDLGWYGACLTLHE